MIEQEALNGIYMEAGIFVLVILTMSVISYKISSKNAKEYALKNKKNLEDKKVIDEELINAKEIRVKELQKMLDESMITDEEFKVMKKRLYNTQL